MTQQINNTNNKMTHNSLWLLHCFMFISSLMYYITQPLMAAGLSTEQENEQETTAQESKEQLISFNQVNAGRLLFQTDNKQYYQPALLLKTDVSMEVNGMLAKVNVRQHFKNTSNQWVEGTYVFPLPENAAVNKMRIQIGERIIKGTIKEKKEARVIYQKARAAGKRASLVEQERPNLFTNSISNIAPDTKIIVDISYLQKVSYNKGEFQLRFPMTITPRYIPGKIASDELGQQNLNINQGNGWAMNTDQVADAQRITPPMISTENSSAHKLINPIHISGSINLSMPLESVSSLYHPINISPTNNQ